MLPIRPLVTGNGPLLRLKYSWAPKCLPNMVDFERSGDPVAKNYVTVNVGLADATMHGSMVYSRGTHHRDSQIIRPGYS